MSQREPDPGLPWTSNMDRVGEAAGSASNRSELISAVEKWSRAYFYAPSLRTETGFSLSFFRQSSFFPSSHAFPINFHSSHRRLTSRSRYCSGPLWLRLRTNALSVTTYVASGGGTEAASLASLVAESVRWGGRRENFCAAADPADPSVVGCAPACVAVRRRVGEAA